MNPGLDPELYTMLKEKYDIEFDNRTWLETAFTHASYVNERRHMYPNLEYNERIEFLGDAVLELIVSSYLFREYPNMPEGKMTRLRAAIVREESLAEFAKECQFDRYIRLGKGEEMSGARNRPSLLCDLFEAFLGAVYMDQGLDTVKHFLDIVMFPKVKAGAFEKERDNKTRLQELVQRSGKVSIEYRLEKEEGPAHNRTFHQAVYINHHKIAEGVGRSKKDAEQIAAARAIEVIEARENKE